MKRILYTTSSWMESPDTTKAPVEATECHVLLEGTLRQSEDVMRLKFAALKVRSQLL